MKILGIRANFSTKKEVENLLERAVREGKKVHIVTLNTEMIMQAQADESFKKAIESATLAVAESSGLKLAANFQKYSSSNFFAKISGFFPAVLKTMFGTSREEILPGTDLTVDLVSFCAKEGFKVLFVGGRDGASSQAAKSLKKQFPNLKIDSIDEVSKDENKEEDLINEINNRNAQALFLAFGHGFQEKWIGRNLPRLNVNFAVGVGGTFDFISGKVKRAPVWMRKAGLEWLWRLLRQPWRVKRQVSLIKFLYLLIKGKS